jgi:hypothetical protein
VEDRVLAIQSLSNGSRSWILLSLEGGMFSLNGDVIDGCEYHSFSVLFLEYDYPKYSHDLRWTWDDQILFKLVKLFPMDPSGSNG